MFDVTGAAGAWKKLIFMFEADVNNWDSDAIHLARAADIVRKNIFEHRDHFNCSFDPKCEEDAVPQSLIALYDSSRSKY